MHELLQKALAATGFAVNVHDELKPVVLSASTYVGKKLTNYKKFLTNGNYSRKN